MALVILIIGLSCAEPSGQAKVGSGIKAIPEAEYISRGKSVAMATSAELSAKLQKALADEGVPGAVKYCNLAALPLVDSLSAVHHVEIRRTSLRVRNAENSPTPAEMKILNSMQALHDLGKALKPTVKRDQDGVHFYAPILINAFCLQCHGERGKTLTAEDFAYIRQTYPEDMATGYQEGDFRGIWSIEFGN